MRPWLLGGAGIAFAVVVAVWQIQTANMRAFHATSMATAKALAASERRTFDAYKLQVEQGISDAARIRAEEALVALDRQKALEDENGRLRASYAAAAKERDDASKQLLRILNDATPTDVSPLDSASRDVYRRLRQRQLTPRAASDTPPAGRGAPLRLPDSAGR